MVATRTQTPFEAWSTFIRDYPLCQISVNCIELEYITAGGGEITVVMLPGALGLADTSFRWVPEFERRHTVIAPSYPKHVRDFRTLAAALDGLLDRLATNDVVLLGGSFGGQVALRLAAKAPERFDGLIVADTRLPDSRMEYLTSLARLIERMPDPVMTAIRRITTEPVLRAMSDEQAFWRWYFRNAEERVTARDLHDRLALWIDLNGQPRSELNALARWRGRTLIVESGRDPMISERQRVLLRRALPAAQIVRFRDHDHSASLERPGASIAAILDFLERR